LHQNFSPELDLNDVFFYLKGEGTGEQDGEPADGGGGLQGGRQATVRRHGQDQQLQVILFYGLF
jgi:hypothetical protein